MVCNVLKGTIHSEKTFLVPAIRNRQETKTFPIFESELNAEVVIHGD